MLATRHRTQNYLHYALAENGQLVKVGEVEKSRNPNSTLAKSDDRSWFQASRSGCRSAPERKSTKFKSEGHWFGSRSYSATARLENKKRETRTLKEHASYDPWIIRLKTSPFLQAEPPPVSLDDCLRHLQRVGFLTSAKKTHDKTKYNSRALSLHQEMTLQRKNQLKCKFPPRPPLSLFSGSIDRKQKPVACVT